MGQHDSVYRSGETNVILVKAIPASHNSDASQPDHHGQPRGTIDLIYVDQHDQPVQVKTINGRDGDPFSAADYENLNGHRFGRLLSKVDHFNNGTQNVILMADSSSDQNRGGSGSSADQNNGTGNVVSGFNSNTNSSSNSANRNNVNPSVPASNSAKGPQNPNWDSNNGNQSSSDHPVQNSSSASNGSSSADNGSSASSANSQNSSSASSSNPSDNQVPQAPSSNGDSDQNSNTAGDDDNDAGTGNSTGANNGNSADNKAASAAGASAENADRRAGKLPQTGEQPNPSYEMIQAMSLFLLIASLMVELSEAGVSLKRRHH